MHEANPTCGRCFKKYGVLARFCKAVTVAKGGFFDESKFDEFLFQAKIIISNLGNVLTAFFVHCTAWYFMNKSTGFHGKCDIFWVTPNC